MTSRTVLLVDDDRDSLTIYTLILEHHGYLVLHASTPAEAWSRIRERKPDLVVAELFLPAVDGESLVERIKGSEETARLPVVGISTLAAVRGHPGFSACDSYLPKPCVPSRLLAEVERFLEPELTV